MNIVKLKELIENGLSTYQIANYFNCSSTKIVYQIKINDLVNLYKSKIHNGYIRENIPVKYAKENLEEIVKKSNSFEEVYSKLNLINRGANGKTLRKYIKKYEINTEHFVKFKNLGKISSYMPLEIYLKEKLYKEHYKKRVCELCGQDEIWKGHKISLILDHIDGNHENNDIVNLRIVCPNCNASLPTFAGRNTNKNRIKLQTKFKKEKDKKEKNDNLINQILNSNIDFSKRGWIYKVSILLGKRRQRIPKFMRENMLEFYNTCFK
jgi:hypothetical protein